MNRFLKALTITALVAVTMPSRAVDSDLYLAGLGLHQDTGRNIYLGGIYLEREAPKPTKLTEAKGSRIMEYRVVARRTSMRSLLGGMLLQSEVATGNPPDKAMEEFSDAILTAVNTSLYAGDSLEVRLTQKNETIAILNGYELARISNKSVADYLLMGWVGDSGPSTSFRKDITSSEVDPTLLTALESNTYSKKREAEIASWMEPEEVPEESATNEDDSKEAVAILEDNPSEAVVDVEVEAVIETAAEIVAGEATVNETLHFVQTQSVPIESVLANVAESSSNEFIGAAAGENITSSSDNTQQGEQENSGAMQVASLIPMAEMLPTNSLEKEIQAMGIQEYSQRLSTFHNALVRMVYSEIRYPKRAVRRGVEGRMELDVTMDSQGEVLNIAVAVPSGHDLLDEAAVNAAKNAFSRGMPNGVDPVAIAEFGDFATEQLTVPVPVSFKLQ